MNYFHRMSASCKNALPKCHPLVVGLLWMACLLALGMPRVLAANPANPAGTSGKPSAKTATCSPAPYGAHPFVEATSLPLRDVDYSIDVHPNPNAGRFRLEVTGTISDTVELVIINAQGKKVYTRPIDAPGSFLFNLTPLRQGIYFAQLRQAGKVVSLPIIYAYQEPDPTLPALSGEGRPD
jgi:hypothetical protein